MKKIILLSCIFSLAMGSGVMAKEVYKGYIFLGGSNGFEVIKDFGWIKDKCTTESTSCVVESTTEATTRPVVESTTQATTKPVVESTTEATTKPVVESTTQETTRPVVESTTESTTEASGYEKELLNLVNNARKQQGLGEVKLSESLSNVARIKSEDMSKNNYFSHTSPTYGTPFEMLKKFQISYKTAGENIARGQKNAQEVFNAWMNSEGHRKNILNGNFTQMGIGLHNGYWTQIFIG